MTDFDAWLNSIPEYVEYKQARDAEIAAMPPKERAELEKRQAMMLDMALWGETFIDSDGNHVKRNDARDSFRVSYTTDAPETPNVIVPRGLFG